MSKRKRKVRPMVPQEAPRDYRAQHDELVVEDVAGGFRGQKVGERKRVKFPTPLDRYRSRGQIDETQHSAGTRLYADWFVAGGSPIAGQILERVSIGPSCPTVGVINARRRYAAAMQAVGYVLSPVITHVCLLEQSADGWARLRGRPDADGIAALRLALDALARHYGLN